MIISRQKARYSILGAMIGDAFGTTFEFKKKSKVAEELISKNFENGLLGGGPFCVEPGQFTDDSEMAVGIMKVIYENGSYDQKLVAAEYHKWFLSPPFDIGMATSNAVSRQTASEMIAASIDHNKKSLSNGFLMRMYGLVGLYYDKPLDELLPVVEKDIMLTHSHEETLKIGKFYAELLWWSINDCNCEKIYEYMKSKTYGSNLLKAIYTAVDKSSNVFEWNDYKYDFSEIDGQFQGFVGFAIWLLLKSMKNFTDYYQSVMFVVKQGGDTDTNACIVGAVMGALYPKTIPDNWIKSVISFRNESRFEKYPNSNPENWKKWLP